MTKLIYHHVLDLMRSSCMFPCVKPLPDNGDSEVQRRHHVDKGQRELNEEARKILEVGRGIG